MNFSDFSDLEQVKLPIGEEGESLESLALVLESVGLDVVVDSKEHTLWVRRNQYDLALEQLQLYKEENRHWPPLRKQVEPHPLMPPTVLLLGGLIFFYLVTGAWKQSSPWFVHGAVDAAAVRDGQWWRLLTGLSLHADSRHLLGNCCLGGVLVHLLSRQIGFGLAWALLIGCGAAGNWCNVVFRQTDHLSVGFSTAVFAVVGLLSGMQMVQKEKMVWQDVLLSLGAGMALLALLGTAGGRTDLGAHFFGFWVGAGCGILAEISGLIRWARPESRQRYLFGVTLGLVVWSWWWAMG
nr:rhomboid family intramembrane serine protease [uncultured Desulfobulbus sp.]